jgi:hypothetical protein
MASQKENVKFNLSKSLEIIRALNLNGTMPKGIPKSGTRKPGAGRKAGPQTVTLSFRVPINHAAFIKLLVQSFLLELKNEPS